MAFTSAASVVVANVFQLVDPNGIIVGTLGSTGPFASGTSINLIHNNPSTTDSFIWWSQPATFGNASSEAVFSGPEKSGAAGNAAALTFAVDVASGTKTTSLVDSNVLALATENAAGTQQAELDLLANGDWQVFANQITVVDPNAVSRGKFFGLKTYTITDVAGVALPIGVTNVLSLTLDAQPVSGGAIIVYAAFSISGGATSASWSLTVDGALQTRVAATTSTTPVTSSQMWVINAMPIKAAYVITLSANAVGATNSVANRTSLSCLQLS